MASRHEVKHETDQFEHAPGYEGTGRPPFKRRLLAHYKKYWWLHLAIFLILGLLITLLLIFVAFPRIAQDGVNDSTLVIRAQSGLNPTPNTVDVQLVTISHSGSVFHPTLDSFDAALYLPDAGPDKPFGHLTIPKIKSTKSTLVSLNQTMEIVDQDQFTEYNKRTLQNLNYVVALTGRTALHQGSFPTAHVKFQKTVNTTGLNGFKGFKIQTFNISILPLPDGSNNNGTVLIPNPSTLTLALGNVTLDVTVNGTAIGNSTLLNVFLRPGDNIVQMKGFSEQVTVVNLIKEKYNDGILPITLTGKSVVYNGVHLPYYEAPFQTNVQNTQLDVGKALAAAGLSLSAILGSGNSSSSAAGSSSTSASGSSSTSAPALFPPASTSSSSGGLFPAASSSSSSAPALFPTSSSESAAPASSSSAPALFATSSTDGSAATSGSVNLFPTNGVKARSTPKAMLVGFE